MSARLKSDPSAGRDPAPDPMRQRSTLSRRSICLFAGLAVALCDMNAVEERGMMNKDRLDRETADLVSAAFEKSWSFVTTDPKLADDNLEAMRARLSRHLQVLARNGERDMWRLANSAIGEMRRDRRVS
jgi:hypothetical protein